MKKIICFIEILSLMICLCGCGKKEKIETQPEFEPQVYSEDAEKPELTIDWTADHISMGESYLNGLIHDDVFYGVKFCDHQYAVDVKNAGTGDLISSIPIGEMDDVNGISVSPDGIIYIVGQMNDQFQLYEISSKAYTCQQKELVLEDIEDSVADSIEFRGLYSDQSGSCYIWFRVMVLASLYDDDVPPNSYFYADRIYVKDSGLQTLYYEDVLDRIDGPKLFSVLQDFDGSVVMIARDQDVKFYSEKLSPQSLEGCVKTELDQKLEHTVDNICAVTDNGFLFTDGNVVKEYSYGDQSTHVLFHLSTYGLVYSDVMYIKKDSDMIHILNDFGDDNQTEYTKIYKDAVDKTVVVLGYVMESNTLEKCVSQFNHYHNDMQILLKRYGDEHSDYDANMQAFKRDILRGDCPDIIYTDGIGISEFCNKGLYANLYEFMEKDPEFHKSDINQQILYTYEIDGKLYSIAPEFFIYSMAGKKSIWGDRYGISVNEMQETLEKNGRNINSISGFSEDEPILVDLCTTMMDELIDWKTGECHFDSDEFREILETAKSYNGKYIEWPDGIKNNDIMLQTTSIYRVSDYQLLKRIYQEDITFVGFPTQKTTGTSLSFIGGEVAISQLSEKKDICWEFVKYYVTHGCNEMGFPCVNQLFENMMDAAQTDTIETDESGNKYITCKDYFYCLGYEIEIYAADEEDVETITNLIQRADIKREYHPDIVNIILEETQPYFQDQKPVDEVMEVIQSRISLYLKELAE